MRSCVYTGKRQCSRSTDIAGREGEEELTLRQPAP